MMVLNQQAENQILEESKQQDEGAKIVCSSENVKELVLSEDSNSLQAENKPSNL